MAAFVEIIVNEVRCGFVHGDYGRSNPDVILQMIHDVASLIGDYKELYVEGTSLTVESLLKAMDQRVVLVHFEDCSPFYGVMFDEERCGCGCVGSEYYFAWLQEKVFCKDCLEAQLRACVRDIFEHVTAFGRVSELKRQKALAWEDIAWISEQSSDAESSDGFEELFFEAEPYQVLNHNIESNFCILDELIEKKLPVPRPMCLEAFSIGPCKPSARVLPFYANLLAYSMEGHVQEPRVCDIRAFSEDMAVVPAPPSILLGGVGVLGGICRLLVQNPGFAWPSDACLKLVYGSGFGFQDLPLDTIQNNEICELVLDFPKKDVILEPKLSVWAMTACGQVFGLVVAVQRF